MNPFIGATERELSGAVADWASRNGLAERIPAAEKEGGLPSDLIADLGRLGVLGMTIPEGDGGLGASAVAFALVLEELSAAWPSLAVGVAVNSGIVASSVVRFGSPDQRKRWLPTLMDGKGLGAFALTEASSGSDAASLRMTARRDGTGWRIDGQKHFITNARYAPFAIVLARVGEFDPKRTSAGITAFVVPLDAPGVSLGPSERKMGLRASDTSALILEDARVGDDGVLGEVGKGFAIAMSGLDGGRIGIAAQSVGIARRALELARAYSKQRKQFGRPIADFEGLRFRLAKADSDLAAARLLALRAAWLRDRGMAFTREAAMAKLFASEMAQRATHAAVQILGGNGYMRDYAVERYARDGRATTIYEGTSEIQRIVIARSLLAAA